MKKKIAIKEQWDFKGMYSGISDPKIEKDIRAIESAYSAFSKKYEKNAAYMTDASKLRQAMDDWKALMEATGICAPLWYLHLVMDTDTDNSKIRSLFDGYNERMAKSSNQIVFFNLNLAKISKADQDRFLADPSLAEYRMHLGSIFEIARYNLPEGEEKILNLLHAPSHQMWVSAQSKLLTSKMVKHKGKMIPLTEAQAIKADLPIKERRALHAQIIGVFKDISFFAEAELNAVIARKRAIDDLRGFSKPYASTVIGYQNSVKSVENLVAAVTRRMGDSTRFFKLKAKVLGLKKLTLAEVGTKMSKGSKKQSLEESIGMISAAFGRVSPKFSEMFESFLRAGNFDIHPRKGKRGGAYCSGGYGVPTKILLNHADDMQSASTMAHEMGHAIHFELSKKQSVLYQDFTISIAEVASTFFENVLFDYALEQASEKERLSMLLEKVQDDMLVIYSQIAYFNFETELHGAVRAKGSLSNAEMAAMFLKCRKSYLGNAFEYAEGDGYAYVAIPHFRYFFYVYAYAYGQLIADALYAEYKKDPAFLEKIEAFLSAGGSKKPDDVFKDIGIDVTKPDFFEKGLDALSERLKRVEKLVAKANSSR